MEKAMTLRVSGKNLDIGEALRTHIHGRIETAAAKYFAGPIIGHVTIEPEGSGFRTDCTLHLRAGITLQADAEAFDPYASFDRAADRIEKRLSRHKSRLKDRHAGNGAEAALIPTVTNYVLKAPEENEEDIHEFEAVVIAESSLYVKEMPVADAVMELDLTGAQIMIFRHAIHGRLNIVYRRMDGHIGWIDPVIAAAP
jgi:ribosomal subunit interface protein